MKCLALLAASGLTAEAGGKWCSFVNEPRIPYFWDESCLVERPGRTIPNIFCTRTFRAGFLVSSFVLLWVYMAHCGRGCKDIHVYGWLVLLLRLGTLAGNKREPHSF